ncbi:hypothetical protein [Acinetobacter ursingii]|uniref:hypothetical protein n=1 Tax=Acinetobacter ursingii TaxID=108980 RepID=UPI000E6A9856|nr:hypothetical protein [Acinetobacter ursingii]
MAYSNVTPMVQQVHQKTWFQKFRGRLAAGTAATTGLILANSAHAEGTDLTAVGTAITGQLGAAGTIIVSILVAAATLTAMIIGYRKLNKGANAA